MQTDLAYGIAVNKGSTLQREWISVKPPGLPASLVGVPGITTVYEERNRTGDYVFKAEVDITVSEPISAIEILFVCFDLWGKPLKNLSLTEVKDMQPGSHKLQGRWRAFENEVSEFYASIAYVNRIRTTSGRVIEADRTKVIDEGRRLYSKFSDQNALPDEKKK